MDTIPPIRGALVQHIKGQSTRWETAGVRQLQLLKSCYPLMTRGGLNHPTGNRCGPLCQHVIEEVNFLWLQKKLQRTIRVQ